MLIYCDLSPLKYPGKEQISTPVPRQAALSLSRAPVRRQAACPCRALGWLVAGARMQHFSGVRGLPVPAQAGAHGARDCSSPGWPWLRCSVALNSGNAGFFPVFEALGVWISCFESAYLSLIDQSALLVSLGWEQSPCTTFLWTQRRLLRVQQ